MLTIYCEVKDHYLCPEYEVSYIKDVRFSEKNGYLLEFDTRYVGFELEENWQPEENVRDCIAYMTFWKNVQSSGHPASRLLSNE